MSLIRDARTLHQKSISSIRSAMTAFNSFHEDGRITSVLLLLQHSAEMLLKTILCQNKEGVFDKDTGNSIGFERCLGLCQAKYDLHADECGIFRTIDSLRDAEQHWFVVVPEDFLYVHTRAFITAFDTYLKRSLQLDLHAEIPARVLPVSTKPPGDFDFLVDREYKLIAELLKPGKRQRDEARARIRALLAMESLVTDAVGISQKDVNRIEKAIKSGSNLVEVFPRLNTIQTEMVGDGPTLTVRFSKKEGAPVQFVGGDDPKGAAAVREIDLQKKFHMRASDLAKKLNLTEPKSRALRKHLKIDEGVGCRHVFTFGKTSICCFSDNAYIAMHNAILAGIDMEQVWQENKP